MDESKQGIPPSPKDYKSDIKPVWCPGCGDFAVLSAIAKALAFLALPRENVALVSGIGCSSKTPAYFLNSSHGFNAVHGRMPAVATGANAANRDATIATDSRLTRPGMWAGFMAGIVVILGNPKAILFYMGVLPGFFDLTQATAADIAIIGEVGLSGELRAVAQLETRLKEAAKLGFKRAVLPASTQLKQLKSPPLALLQVRALSEALEAALI